MTTNSLNISTKTYMQFVDITDPIQDGLRKNRVQDAVLHIYNPHTTAGITINEGADPDVQADIIAVLNEMLPDTFQYRHSEGNSPSHIMASLMGSSVSVFVENGQLQLGTWQRIFFCEFDGPRNRKILWRAI